MHTQNTWSGPTISKINGVYNYLTFLSVYNLQKNFMP